jgi:hypothetical protein
MSSPRKKHFREVKTKLSAQELERTRDQIMAMRASRHMQNNDAGSDGDVDLLANVTAFVAVTDREFMLEAVSTDPLALAFASNELCDDFDVVIAAVTLDARALQFASIDRRADRAVVLTALRADWAALQYVTFPAFFEDAELMLTAVSRGNKALPFVASSLMDDVDFVKAAVAIDSNALAFASERLRADREIVLLSVAHDPAKLYEALNEVQGTFMNFQISGIVGFSSKSFVKSLEKSSENSQNSRDNFNSRMWSKSSGVDLHNEGQQPSTFLPVLVDSPEIAKNYEQTTEIRYHNPNMTVGSKMSQYTAIILDAARRDGRVLQYAAKELRNDRDIVFTAISNSADALEFGSEELRTDDEFMHRTLPLHGGRCLRWILEPLVSDRQFLVDAVVANAKALKYVAQELRHDKDFIVTVVKLAATPLAYVPSHFYDDPEVMLAAVANDGGALVYASPSLCTDQEFVLSAVKLRGDARREDAPDLNFYASQSQ